MARFLCLFLLIAIVYSVYSYSEFEEAELRQQENLEILGRSIDTYEVTRYMPSLENKTIRDCDRGLRNVYKVQFAALKASTGREYYGHIVNTAGEACFATVAQTSTESTIKDCLETATTNSAIAFHYDQTAKTCSLYNNWREHKFRQCKRGSSEKMYYLQTNRPDNHDPCASVTMALSAAYTSNGTVTVTATFNNAPCICDVDRIEYRFLGTTYFMTIPDYTYTYLSSQSNNWRNTTEVRAFVENDEVATNLNYIPDNDL